MSIRNVISKLGGISATARGLGHRNVTTVQGWWDRELIPAQRQREVLDYAARIDVALSPDEIIPPARRPPSGDSPSGNCSDASPASISR